ncbi:MAG: hypothetical protein JKY94_11295, partial [Rhodobacteraceae bacterium]|nr:hypothetical protein [Paracoccaceae bacterium]
MNILKRISASAIGARRALMLGAVLMLALTGFATPAHALCRQALALGLDVSGS